MVSKKPNLFILVLIGLAIGLASGYGLHLEWRSYLARASDEREACNDAYKRELARLKTWRSEQLARLDGLPEAKKLEAQLVIDYTMQIAAGKLQGAIIERTGEECKHFRIKTWPEGIEKIGEWIDAAIRFVAANLRWSDAAQADEATVRLKR